MNTITMKDPIELRKAGLKALNAALGYDDTQAFLRQYSGTGNFTKDRHELHKRSFEEVTADILKRQTEHPERLTIKRAIA